MEIMASVSLMYLSLFKILQRGFNFYDYFFPRVCFILRNFLDFFSAKCNSWRTRIGNMKVVDTCNPLDKLTSDGHICMEDMKIVMARLGIACHEGDDDDDDDNVENWKIEVSEFSEIMLDEEPNLMEIKQAFEVFDENKDGFIDATELQRVLRGLCIEEGSNLEKCRRMICAFDDNGDGLLDFEEFVAFMDKCFS